MGINTGFENLNEINDLQFIPVNDKKVPTVKNWQKTKTKYDLSTCYGVGLACGEISGGLEALDFDLKYDLTQDLFVRYKRLITSYSDTLLKKLVVQGTKNKGFHLIYRCKKVSSWLHIYRWGYG